MRGTVVTSLLTACLVAAVSGQTGRLTFFDDFEDGDADGWWLGYSHHTPWVNGNWRVENGLLVQDQAGDAFVALVEGINASSQSVAVDASMNGPAGYSGIVLWYRDASNWTNVQAYPAVGLLGVAEYYDGVVRTATYEHRLAEGHLYRLAVDADAASGTLAFSVDGIALFTHQVSTPNRSGRTGLYSGNSGGYFDNFAMSYQPAPSFQGFLDPVANPPVINSVKAGAAVPLKFSLGGNFGLDILAPGFPISQPMPCSGGPALAELEEAVAAGQSGLTYDEAQDQYTYVWKTDRAWVQSCRQLLIALTGGTTHVAHFQFAK